MLLLGIAINAASAAGLALLTALASEGQLKTLSFWMLGGFASLDWPVVIAMLGSTYGAGGAILMSQSPALAALRARGTWRPLSRRQRGPAAIARGSCHCRDGRGRSRRSAAASDLSALRRHIARLTVGASPRRALPMAALIGALLCVLADLIARSIAPPIELPVAPSRRHWACRCWYH